MVYRIYVEKKAGLDNEARALLSEIKTFLGIDSIERVRIINRYDAENITAELFDYAVGTVFSEPQLDEVYKNVENDGAVVFATEYLPGQFDQRADSAAQCIQLISQGDKPTVASARVYMLYGRLSKECEEFSELYPSIPVTAIPDSIWQSFKSGVPLAAAYALYEKKEAVAREKASSINEKNKNLSSGSLSKGKSEEYFTPSEVRAMSAAEVKANYSKILTSMSKWH